MIKTTFRNLDREEKLNVITHGGGFFLYLVLFPVLIFKTNSTASFYQTLGLLVFALCSYFMLASSTIYHWVSNPKEKKKYQIWDHIAIYFMIGGSYTVYLLWFFPWEQIQYFFLIHWAIIAMGVVFKIFFTGKFKFLSTVLYLLLGWMIVLIWSDAVTLIPDKSILCVMLGGLFYTTGVLFYALDKRPYFHAIWHVFVLLGLSSHFVGIWLTT